MPNIEDGWDGAPQEEIAEIEAIAGRPLPNFYRWFLRRMGRYMGALSFASIDFTAGRVIDTYRVEIKQPDPRYLLIGYQTDPMVPMHVWYDLERPARDDSLVFDREIEGKLVQLGFETLRELLAWKAMFNFKLPTLPSRCKGKLRADNTGIGAQLARVLSDHGFEHPLSTGPFCGLFDRPDAAMICRASPQGSDTDRLYFRLAAASDSSLRRLLRVVEKEADLEVEVDEP
ncbi:SMI1/KNR4 family protein [Nannocystis pusilla]|uniref:SMI1/KNR4 family protein n=1 Tax=Nannocystis pusilla TaxID=889268 RepID=UPI003DA54CA4